MIDKKHLEHENRIMEIDDKYARLFSSDLGKEVLADLYEFCGMNTPCFGKTNDETNKLLGTRVAGLYVNDKINRVHTRRINRIRDEREAYKKDEKM